MKKKLTVVYTGVGLICLLCLVLSIVLVRGSLDELGLSTMFPSATPSADPEKVILYKQPKNPTEIHTAVPQKASQSILSNIQV